MMLNQQITEGFALSETAQQALDAVRAVRDEQESDEGKRDALGRGDLVEMRAPDSTLAMGTLGSLIGTSGRYEVDVRLEPIQSRVRYVSYSLRSRDPRLKGQRTRISPFSRAEHVQRFGAWAIMNDFVDPILDRICHYDNADTDEALRVLRENSLRTDVVVLEELHIGRLASALAQHTFSWWGDALETRVAEFIHARCMSVRQKLNESSESIDEALALAAKFQPPHKLPQRPRRSSWGADARELELGFDEFFSEFDGNESVQTLRSTIHAYQSIAENLWTPDTKRTGEEFARYQTFLAMVFRRAAKLLGESAFLHCSLYWLEREIFTRDRNARRETDEHLLEMEGLWSFEASPDMPALPNGGFALDLLKPESSDTFLRHGGVVARRYAELVVVLMGHGISRVPEGVRRTHGDNAIEAIRNVLRAAFDRYGILRPACLAPGKLAFDQFRKADVVRAREALSCAISCPS